VGGAGNFQVRALGPGPERTPTTGKRAGGGVVIQVLTRGGKADCRKSVRETSDPKVKREKPLPETETKKPKEGKATRAPCQRREIVYQKTTGSSKGGLDERTGGEGIDGDPY